MIILLLGALLLLAEEQTAAFRNIAKAPKNQPLNAVSGNSDCSY
jgi:hypothetical protein